ncbi:hypothetical protein MMC29_005718 [Sticta canariensis]|nr:hypothetical protein [Sticta canariensis]
MLFDEQSPSKNSEPKICASRLDEPGTRSRRSDGPEPLKAADPITCDGFGLLNDRPSKHRSFQGSQSSTAPGYHPKEAPTIADPMMEFLRDLSESFEEVQSIASGKLPISGDFSPVVNSLSHVKEPNIEAGVSSIVSHKHQSISENHDLFESCAENITSLLDLVDRYPTRERSRPIYGVVE